MVDHPPQQLHRGQAAPEAHCSLRLANIGEDQRMTTPDDRSGEMRVQLGWPSKTLNPNSREHWAEKARAVKAARAEAGWALRRQFRTKPQWDRVAVALEFCPPDDRRRDLQNCIGAAKALVDGIADAIGIDDSRFDCSYRFGAIVKGGAVNVTVRSA